MQDGLAFQLEGDGGRGVACSRLNWGVHRRSHVLRYLQETGDESRQEVAHFLGVCFECGQFPLAVVKAGETLTVVTCLLWVESHSSSVAYSP
jgi:hypothetical protein